MTRYTVEELTSMARQTLAAHERGDPRNSCGLPGTRPPPRRRLQASRTQCGLCAPLWEQVMDWIGYALVALIFAAIGSCEADKNTFRDCAKHGSAYMQGTGWIDCTVRKQGGLK
jgi:hypothetical protein